MRHMIRRRPTVTALLQDILVTLPLLLSWPAGAQDAAPADRNAINARAHPGNMMADSPVTFPKEGALPAKYPPDVHVRDEPAEKDYYIFSSPCRSLAQIAEIQAAMPKGRFTPPAPDWRPLRRTRQILTEGGELRLLALGDSIVNDTMRSGWVARLAEAYPKARIQATVYVRGGGDCQHFKELDRIATNVIPRRPNLVFIGGISQRDIESIGEVIHQLRAGSPEVEILLATGAFGTADPRDPEALAKAPHSGTGAYGQALRKLAAEEGCAFLDMTAPWAEYIRSAQVHPHLFYRDVVHANEYGEQILSKILMAFWTAPEPDPWDVRWGGYVKALDPPESGFYAKRLDYEGIPIKAPTNVVDEALFAARERLSMMLSNLPSVRASLRAAGAELHIIGRDQVTTDLPEWRQDKGKPLAEYNGLTRDQRTRGMGGLLTSCGEENLLKLEKDRYRGRDICVHEFAHNILGYGVSSTFREKVRQQYRRSLERGLWVGSYAGSNYDEFFAELTMWHFGTHGDLHMKDPKPAVGREGLKAYDPEAFTLLDDFYSGRMEPAVAKPR